MKEEEKIADQLKNIDNELENIEKELSQLQARRRKLLELKEKLKNDRIHKKSLELSSQNWTKDYSWSKKVREILKTRFKLEDFRPMQLKTINAILSNQDVLFLAPTGGGKSLCFQLPACVTDGITIVISPLLSLCEDQVWRLDSLGIKAKMLNSTTDKDTAATIHKVLSEKSSSCSIKLLYVTPERLAKSKRFMNTLQKAYGLKKLDRFAIDEVHCCSQWGHDFRPDYKFLGTLKTLFPDIPILGVTATATAKVIEDCKKMLNIQHALLFNAPFNRPNLYYHVIEKPSEKDKVNDMLAELLKTRYRGKCGIIYTFSIKDAEDITSELLQRDVKVRPYHANLVAEKRTRIHSKWLSGEIQAVVATVAFGMGIDKPDVRFVIHHTLSKSIENFYQESGRAGRDGNHAECIIFYRLADAFRITTMMFSEYTGLKNAYSIINYCINGTKCRRDLIATHFSEVWNESSCAKMCDYCFYYNRIKVPQSDISNDCKSLRRIIRIADQMKINLTALKLVDAWYGKGPTSLRIEVVPKYDRYYAEQIIAYLITNDYLKEEFSFTPYATHSYIKQGPEIIPESGIKFQCARVYNLPKENKFNISNAFSIKSEKRQNDSDDEEVVLVSCSSSSKKKQKYLSETVDTDSSGSHKHVKRMTNVKNKISNNIDKNSLTPLPAKKTVQLEKDVSIIDKFSPIIDLDDDTD